MLVHYRKIQRGTAGLYIAYVIVATIGGQFSPKNEIFPVFNWSLFTYVSDERTISEVEVLAINGTALAAPTRFYDLPRHFSAARSKSVNVKKLADRMIAAHQSGDLESFESLRRLLESSYLSEAGELTYRLVVNLYNPIERWRSGTIRSTIVIGEYTIDGSRS